MVNRDSQGNHSRGPRQESPSVSSGKGTGTNVTFSVEPRPSGQSTVHTFGTVENFAGLAVYRLR